MKHAFFVTAIGCTIALTGLPMSDADRIVDGYIPCVNGVWHFEDGKINWLFNPTAEKGPLNPEWTWGLNRMYFWKTLAKAYRQTKDEKYAKAFVRQFTDWMEQTGGVPTEGAPREKRRSTFEQDYNAVGSPWRTIEEGIRLSGSWPTAEDAFAGSPFFTPEIKQKFIKVQWLQARHLMKYRTDNNWLLMEMNGVYTFASRHPEFPECEGWRKESAAILADAVSKQILPDGLQYELSPDYNWVVFGYAIGACQLARQKGHLDDFPPDYLQTLERCAMATLALMTPAFVQPRFNDCYTIRTSALLASAAKTLGNRPEFAWVLSEGREGTPPKGEMASRFLPYSGFAVMRSDWSRNATYLAFDVGPLGVSHSHQDKLGFTLWKGDEELVFDDGGGQYERSPERQYGLSGYDHNTLLVDGLAQVRQAPRMVTEPIDAGWISTPERDYARGTYDQGFGPKELRLARHLREIEFQKPERFIITDTIDSADWNAHDYEILFQLDTMRTDISSDRKTLVAHYGRKWDLKIEVSEGGTISTVVGQKEPRLSGWYIARSDKKNHPCTTVSVKPSEKKLSHRFVTVLTPVKGEKNALP